MNKMFAGTTSKTCSKIKEIAEAVFEKKKPKSMVLEELERVKERRQEGSPRQYSYGEWGHWSQEVDISCRLPTRSKKYIPSTSIYGYFTDSLWIESGTIGLETSLSKNPNLSKSVEK